MPHEKQTPPPSPQTWLKTLCSCLPSVASWRPSFFTAPTAPNKTPILQSNTPKSAPPSSPPTPWHHTLPIDEDLIFPFGLLPPNVTTDSASTVSSSLLESKTVQPTVQQDLPPATFQPKQWFDVQPQKNDIIIFLVSDKNPLFNENTYEAEMRWTQHVAFKYCFQIPSGTLQKHSIELDMALEGKKADKPKTLKDGQSKETQNANRIMGALEKLGIKRMRWKPLHEVRKTPKVTTTSVRRRDELIQELTDQLRKKSVPFKIQSGHLYIPPYVVTLLDRDTQIKIGELKQIQNLETRTATQKVEAEITHQEAPFFGSYVHDLEESKDDSLLTIVTPWEAIAGSQKPLPGYRVAQLKFEEQLKDQDYKKLFEEMINNVTQERIQHFFDNQLKDKTKIDKQQWLKDNLERAKPYVEAYLREEIPFFQMLIDQANARFEETGGRTHLAYPMSSPLGKCVFEFVAKISQVELSNTNAFEFVDTTTLMEYGNKATMPLSKNLQEFIEKQCSWRTAQQNTSSKDNAAAAHETGLSKRLAL